MQLQCKSPRIELWRPELSGSWAQFTSVVNMGLTGCGAHCRGRGRAPAARAIAIACRGCAASRQIEQQHAAAHAPIAQPRALANTHAASSDNHHTNRGSTGQGVRACMACVHAWCPAQNKAPPHSIVVGIHQASTTNAQGRQGPPHTHKHGTQNGRTTHTVNEGLAAAGCCPGGRRARAAQKGWQATHAPHRCRSQPPPVPDRPK